MRLRNILEIKNDLNGYKSERGRWYIIKKDRLKTRLKKYEDFYGSRYFLYLNLRKKLDKLKEEQNKHLCLGESHGMTFEGMLYARKLKQEIKKINIQLSILNK